MKELFWLILKIIIWTFAIFCMVIALASLAINANAQGFKVIWDHNPPADSVDYYCLYRDGELIATEYDTCFTDTTLSCNQWHDYYIRAVNVDGVSEPSNGARGLWLSWNNELNYQKVCYLDSTTIVFDMPPGGIEGVNITITAGVVTMQSRYDVNKDGRISLADLGAISETGTIPEGFIELYGKPCVWKGE